MNNKISMHVEKKILLYINNIEEREPIFVDNFYTYEINRNVIIEILTRLVDNLILRKYSSNIYYKPKNTLFGELGINKEKLVKRLYIQNNNEIFGYITGPSIWNYFRLTTQIPNKKWIVSNNVKANYEDDDLRVKLIVPKILIDTENYKLLQILDVIEDKNNICIQDLNDNNYYKFLESIAKSDKKTINKL
ncbi:hypothetical protein, partial [Clostridium butyricum]